jgi:hypothetical protein
MPARHAVAETESTLTQGTCQGCRCVGFSPAAFVICHSFPANPDM